MYEGYLGHYGRPRLFDPADDELALLLGDYLYAHGLVRIAATGSVDAVAELAELISAARDARGTAEDDGAGLARRGRRSRAAPSDDAAVERALAVHRRVGSAVAVLDRRPRSVDAATEGRQVILGMLIVGLIFVGVISLGETTGARGTARRARRRAARTTREAALVGAAPPNPPSSAGLSGARDT